jgi:hypothetical protein
MLTEDAAYQNIEITHTLCVASDKLPIEAIESGKFRELQRGL